MNAYSQAIKAYLEPKERSQKALADAIGSSQPTVARYASGERFPESLELAQRIDAATAGEVPIALWQRVAMERLGIPAPRINAPAAEAA